MAQVPPPTKREIEPTTEMRTVPGLYGPVEKEVTTQPRKQEPTGGRYLARSIEQARKRGADDQTILEKIVIENQNHPNFGQLNAALARGADAKTIVDKIYEDNRKKNFFERISNSWRERVENTQEIISNEQSQAEDWFQTGGQAAGFVGDVAWEGLVALFNGVEKITPNRFDARMQQGWQQLLEDPYIQKGVAVLGTGIERYNEWKNKSENNARAARSIEAAFNYLDVIPVSYGTKKGIDAAGQVGKLDVNLPEVNLGRMAIENARESTAKNYEKALNLTPTQRRQQPDVLNRYGRTTAQFLVDEGVKLRSSGGNVDTTEAVEILRDRARAGSQVFDNILSFQNKRVDIEDLRKAAIREAVDKPGYEKIGNERDRIINIINREFDALRTTPQFYGGYTDDAGNLMITMQGANRIKRHFWTQVRNFTDPDISALNTADLSSGHAIRQFIEDSVDDIDVKAANQKLSEYYTAIKILENRNGAKLPGGRLGGMMAGIVGSIAGSGAGIEGVLAGNYTGRKIAELLSQPEINTFAQRMIIKRLEREGKTDILEDALSRLNMRREDFFTTGALLGAPQSIRMGGGFDTIQGRPRSPETNPMRLLPSGEFAEPFNSDDFIRIPPRGRVPSGIGDEPSVPRINTTEFFDAPNPESINRSLTWYRDGGYKNVNEQLRTGKPVPAPERTMEMDFGFVESTDETIANLDLITSEPLGRPTTLYRGLRPDGSEYAKWQDVKVGDTIEEKGFVSTTPSEGAHVGAKRGQTGKEYAAAAYATNSFLKDKMPIVLEINTGPNTRAYRVPDSVDPEVLLQRNQTMKVVDISEEKIYGNDTRIISIELGDNPN